MKFECDCKDADEVAELPRMEMGRWGVKAVGKSWLQFSTRDMKHLHFILCLIM